MWIELFTCVMPFVLSNSLMLMILWLDFMKLNKYYDLVEAIERLSK